MKIINMQIRCGKLLIVKNLGDYHLYLKTDAFLLADAFENLRKKAIETYNLDPTHYYTLPGFS